MDLETFKANIPELVDEAVEAGKKMSEGRTVLTVSIDSIKDMDPIVEYLHHLWDKKLIDDHIAWNISYIFGTLLGEIIIKEQGFHWEIFDNLPVVGKNEKNWVSPISKIYKIITDTDDGEGMPSNFYDSFKVMLQYESMSDEEKEKLTIYVDKED